MATQIERSSMWRSLLEAGGARGVAPGLMRELGIYGGAQRIWVDKAQALRWRSEIELSPLSVQPR